MRNGIVWQPLPGSQTLLMSCPAQVILAHGSRGPGKTDAQLMRFRRKVGQGYGRFWRGVIFDREYKNLDDLVSKSQRWFPMFGDKARFLSSKGDYKWVWPTGEELLFRVVKKTEDYWDYHGQEFPFIGWNELTKYPDIKLFEAMMSCNRSSFRSDDYPIWDMHTKQEIFLPKIPLEVFATTNPFGPGHNWVKKHFITGCKPGQIQREAINVFNPQTQQREDVVITRTHIFGTYKENKYLDPQYVATLEKITDKNRRKAWLAGSWDIVSGGMFDDVWDEKTHFIKPFDIPRNWTLSRSFDYGSSKPFSVGWWAKSDGSDVRTSNGWRSTVKGDCFRIAEWYGSTGNTNEGLRMLTADIATGIIEREIQMKIHGRVVPGPADNSIWDTEDGSSIAATMAKDVLVDGKVYRGVTWARSNKNPGSRKHGWSQCRNFFAHAKEVDKDGIARPRFYPGVFIFNTCQQFKELVPTLPREEDDPDDVDTDAEDHIGDEFRYFILDQNIVFGVGRNVGT